MNLSAHFTLAEMTASEFGARNGIPNEPGEMALDNLRTLCRLVLEPIRAVTGVVIVTSGYRSPAINAGIGGAKDSAHLYGRAADIHVPGLTSLELANVIQREKLPHLDKCILEFGAWVHVQISKEGLAPLGMYLTAKNVDGVVQFLNGLQE